MVDRAELKEVVRELSHIQMVLDAGEYEPEDLPGYASNLEDVAGELRQWQARAERHSQSDRLDCVLGYVDDSLAAIDQAAVCLGRGQADQASALLDDACTALEDSTYV